MRLFLLENESPVVSRLADALASGRVPALERVRRVQTVDELRGLAVRAGPTAAMLVNWTDSAERGYLLEALLQDPRLSLLPVVVFARSSTAAEFELLKEYGLTRSLVGLTDNLALDCERVAAALLVEQDPKTEASRLRRFFHLVHSGQLDAAGRHLQAELAPSVPPIELTYLRGLLQKSLKAFDEAMTSLAKGLNLTRDATGALAPRFLHLIGNVAFKRRDYERAERFLGAARKLSPANLRREFIYAQLLCETGRVDAALAIFRAILVSCPRYPGVHARVAELGFLNAPTTFAPEEMVALLEHVPERKLLALAKDLKRRPSAAVTAPVAKAMVDRILTLAAEASARDDFYRALHVLSHAAKLMPMTDRSTRIRSLVMRAEILICSEALAEAERLITRLQGAGIEPERMQELKMSLESAKAQQKRGA